MASKETDTVRTVPSDKSPEDVAWDLSKFIKGRKGDSDRESTPEDADEKELRRLRKAREAQEKAEDAERERDIAETAKMLAPVFFALGSQTASRLAPQMPYTFDEAHTLAKSLAAVVDKYTDGLLDEYREEIMLLFVLGSQCIPRYMVWKASQGVDLSSLPQPQQNNQPPTAV